MIQRLVANWVYGGVLAGVLLLVLSPLLIGSWSTALALTFLHLPAYMLHQYEEHDDDRFRRMVNATLGKGREVLSREAVFIINVPGVWGVIALSVYLASKLNLGFALIAVYLVVINGIIHIAQAISMRRYNPGLASAILLFLPLGTFSLWQIQLAGGGGFAFHLAGLLAAIGIHAAIILHVRQEGIRLSNYFADRL